MNVISSFRYIAWVRSEKSVQEHKQDLEECEDSNEDSVVSNEFFIELLFSLIAIIEVHLTIELVVGHENVNFD